MISCTFENGGKGFLRHVTTGIIIRNNKDEILLIKRASHLIRGDKYALPGGYLDRDETAKEGAVREVIEETGLEVKDVQLFRINDNPNRPHEDRQNVDITFIADLKGGKQQLNPEVTEFKWVNKSSLPSKEEFAFDHDETLELYFKYRENPFSLPITNYTHS